MDTHMPAESEDVALSPAEAMALVDRQRADSQRELKINEGVIYAAWGFAWLWCYGLTFLKYGGGTPPLVEVPMWLFSLSWPVAMFGAAMVMTVHLVRTRRGIAGESAEASTLYSLAWAIAFGLSMPVGVLLRPGGAEDPAYWLYPSVIICIVLGTSYLFSAAVWRDRVQYVTGAWILAVNLVGVIAGFAWYPLVLAIGGGGGLLVASAIATARHRR